MTPQILVLISLLFLALSAGCKKKSFLSGPDKIISHHFDPIAELTSVDSFTYYPGATGSISVPYPSDSITNYPLDVDQDSSPDFLVTIEHWYHWVSNSSANANFNYTVSISGTENTSEIATSESTNGPESARFYASGESINPTAKWENKAALLQHGGSVYSTGPYLTGTQYIGLRIKKNSRRHYCWLKIEKVPTGYNTIRIHSFGYNQSNGNDVAAGQGE
jgi:hypothetical protein